MNIPHTAHDANTLDLMAAALETAWLGVAPSHIDRAEMATAISDAVAGGERDFCRLQQTAIDVFASRRVVSVDRRQCGRSVLSIVH